MILIDLISSLKGPNAGFLEAEYDTYREVFPFIYIFPIQFRNDEHKIQNIIMPAAKTRQNFETEDPENSKFMRHRYDGEVGKGLVLTDNYAPVAHLTAGLIRKL